jgi:hypothetical protein
VRAIIKDEIQAIPRKSAAESFLFLLFESGGIDGVIRPGDVTTAIIGAGGGSLLWSAIGFGADIMTSLLPKEIIFPWSGTQSLPYDFPTWQWITATGIVYSCYLAAMRIKRDLEYDPRDWIEEEQEQEKPREIIRPIVNSGNGVIALEPELTPTTIDETLVNVTPDKPIGKARIVPLGRLRDYLLWAFSAGWSRDKAQEWGLGQKEWADIRAFVQRWDRPDVPLWGTKNRPTLTNWVTVLLQTVTNET